MKFGDKREFLTFSLITNECLNGFGLAWLDSKASFYNDFKVCTMHLFD